MSTTQGNGNLSLIFGEPWDVFTEDKMAEQTVQAILQSATPPSNTAHCSTRNGLEESTKAFLALNGEEFFKASALMENPA